MSVSAAVRRKKSALPGPRGKLLRESDLPLEGAGAREQGLLREPRREDLDAERQPLARQPGGTVIAGSPAREAGTVKMSERYMVNGSSAFSPILNAGFGIEGHTTRSADENALSKSSVRSCRASIAFP